MAISIESLIKSSQCFGLAYDISTKECKACEVNNRCKAKYDLILQEYNEDNRLWYNGEKDLAENNADVEYRDNMSQNEEEVKKTVEEGKASLSAFNTIVKSIREELEHKDEDDKILEFKGSNTLQEDEGEPKIANDIKINKANIKPNQAPLADIEDISTDAKAAINAALKEKSNKTARPKKSKPKVQKKYAKNMPNLTLMSIKELEALALERGAKLSDFKKYNQEQIRRMRLIMYIKSTYEV